MTAKIKNFHINGEGAPELSPEEVQSHLSAVKIIDVRRPEEWVGELGHVPGSLFATLGPELMELLKTLSPTDTHVFMCRSGARSTSATLLALQTGLGQSFNAQGGMLAWNQRKFPVARER